MSVIERLLMRRFFKRKNDLPEMYDHMRDGVNRRIYAEDILRLNRASARLDGDPVVMCRPGVRRLPRAAACRHPLGHPPS